jgi:ribonucleoside-diphosphate reductase beta chain
MPGSGEMIQFINRDEDLHLQHFIYITNMIKEEQPELWTGEFKARITANIESAVKIEMEWGLSCIGEGILGLTPGRLTEYLQYVGNRRLKAVGLSEAFGVKQNPFPWLDEMTQGAMTETNFFEGTVREYSSGTLSWD